MLKPRIIIADTDLSYIVPIQLKFVELYFDEINLEIITDQNVFSELFSTPQQADILIISEELYDKALLRHNIENIYLMTEQEEVSSLNGETVHQIYKYTNIKTIFSRIANTGLKKYDNNLEKVASQIVLITSASGGVGKTTLALAVSRCLASIGKRVLYINADYMQSFQYFLSDKTSIGDSKIYSKISTSDKFRYSDFQHIIRHEVFDYLPAFNAALPAAGVPFSVYEQAALAARNSEDYDYVILDAAHVMDENKTKLIGTADKVVFIVKQDFLSVFTVNLLFSSITGLRNEKYTFICNDFRMDSDNALIDREHGTKFVISEYVNHIQNCAQLSIAELSKNEDIQKIAFLIA